MTKEKEDSFISSFPLFHLSYDLRSDELLQKGKLMITLISPIGDALFIPWILLRGKIDQHEEDEDEENRK